MIGVAGALQFLEFQEGVLTSQAEAMFLGTLMFQRGVLAAEAEFLGNFMILLSLVPGEPVFPEAFWKVKDPTVKA